MTTMRQLRRATSSLPDVVEDHHGSHVAFSVAGNNFVTCADGTLRILLPGSRVLEVVERHPETRPLDPKTGESGIEVALSDINGMVLNALIRASWEHCAPPSQAEALHRREHLGDTLPVGLSRPALRALGGAGLHTLDDIATFGRSALETLHGVGPASIQVLEAALNTDGRELR